MTPRAYSYLRMSTPGQIRGDSLRRQLEKSRRYAAEHGLELLESDDLRDIVSAYRGANVTEGRLGKFLEAAGEGRIPAGSVLLVENLDRISRQGIMRSLNLFLSIIGLGITVITLNDGHRYDADSCDANDLIQSITIFQRAYEESLTKADRKREAWKAARADAHLKRMTKKCPAWLEPTAKGPPFFRENPARAAIIRDVFARADRGAGVSLITRQLNEEKVQPFEGSRGMARGWYDSYVQKLLSNPATIGHMRPGRIVDLPDGTKRRVLTGEVIENYYPRAVDPDIFYRVQAGLRSRRRRGGRKGKNVANLFTGGYVRCAYCRAAIAYENKGLKGGSSLICDAARRGLGCTRARWAYRDLETSFLAFVSELDWQGIARGDSGKRATLEGRIRAQEGQLARLRGRMEETFALLDTAPDFVRAKLAEMEAERIKVDKALDDLRAELRSLDYEKRAVKDLKTDIAALQQEGSESYERRLAIQSRLPSVIEMIELAPAGNAPLHQKAIDALRQKGREVEYEALPEYERRYFAVKLVDGTLRTVWPDEKDPTKFTKQLFSTDAGEALRITPEGVIPPRHPDAD